MNATRRRILAGGAGLAAAAGACSLDRLLRDGDWLARLTGLPAGAASYRFVARDYLRNHPEEASRAVLIERLGFDPAALAHLEAAEIDATLFRSIQRDVARDDLVSARGWLLTRTEARLCALGSLSR